ncbi:MAG TPA: lysoplasmalogenase family protein [Clostridia bacterium]|nr:lysoplasmalogenase family protein [Clostridia bacterium]
MPKWCSLALSGSITVFALCNFFEARTIITSLILGAAAFCLSGDLVLSHTIPGGMPLGMLLFATAHAIFITSYVKHIKSLNCRVFTKSFFIVISINYMYMFTLWFFFMRGSGSSITIIGSLIYGLVVSSMTAFTIPLFQADKRNLLTMIGAYSFLTCDSICGIKVAVDFRGDDLIIWGAYIFGLYLIVYSMGKTPITNRVSKLPL